MNPSRRYNPLAPVAPAAATPEPSRSATRRRTAAKAAAPAPAPIAPPAPPRPVAALRLSDLLPSAPPSVAPPTEEAIRTEVRREISRDFMKGGRSAVLPTADEQEARVQERLAAASFAPAPVRLLPTWRRHAPVPA